MLEGARAFIGGMVDGMAEVAAETDQAGKKTEEYGKKARQALSDADRGYSRLGRSMRDLLIRMAVHKSMQLLVDAMRQGTLEAAKFSAEFNGVMSSYKSSFEFVQNAIGGSLGPLLEQMEPYITALADGFAEAVNHVGMFMAALNGQTVYNKAIRTTADYLEDTADAAEKVKRSLAGFDELNIIGQEELNQGVHFEAVEIPQWMQTIGKYVDADVLAMAAMGLGAAGLVHQIVGLIDKFKDKNTALDAQTKKTRADTQAMEVFARTFAPALSGAGKLTQGLLTLGALSIMPKLDLAPFGAATEKLDGYIDIAAKRLDELGLTSPAPTMNTEPLAQSTAAGVEIIDRYNAAEVPDKVAEMDNAPLLKAAGAAEQRIADLDKVNPVRKVMPEIDRESKFNPSAEAVAQTVVGLNKLEIEQMVFKAIETSGLKTSAGEISSILAQIMQSITETINVYNQFQQVMGGKKTTDSAYIPSSILKSSTRTTGYDRMDLYKTFYGNQSSTNVDNQNIENQNTSKAPASRFPAELQGASADDKVNYLWNSIWGMIKSGNFSGENVNAKDYDYSDEELQQLMKEASDIGRSWGFDMANAFIQGLMYQEFSSVLQGKTKPKLDSSEIYEDFRNLTQTPSKNMDSGTKSATITQPYIPSNPAAKVNGMGAKKFTWKEFLDELEIMGHSAAYGAAVFQPTPLLTGEYPGAKMNPEIVSPRNIMYDTVVEANGELVSAMSQMTWKIIEAIENNSSGDIYLDGRKITSTVIDGIRAEKRRIGRSPI